MSKDMSIVKGLLDFIDASPSPYHVIANMKCAFDEAGFTEVKENEEWELAPGRGYYVVRNDSSMIAFRMPVGGCKGFRIAAAHSDSPTFKVKYDPEMFAENYVRLNVEKYGGAIHMSWLDRALSVAGRVAYRTEEGGIATVPVNIDRDLLVIPNQAIHMNREVNQGVNLNPQVDLIPVYALFNGEKEKTFARLVAEAAGIPEESILDSELTLYVREKGRILGANDELILSPKLDDLECVYGAMKGLIEAGTFNMPGDHINVCAVFDNEEVGSGTMQGADSTFLENTMSRIADCLGMSRSRYLQLIADSFLLSADNAHAVHPGHPEKADPVNRPHINGGIVLKYHGGQKYTTDAFSGAVVRDLAKKADVSLQTFYNRSDMVGGSTLGNISTSHVSLPSADIGLPQLAMHSAVETAGCDDICDLVALMTQLFA